MDEYNNGKYEDADAIITIEGRKYALYKNGPLKENCPYMIDVATAEIPPRKQLPLLKSYLLSNGISKELLNERQTHWCICKAIEFAQGKMDKETVVQFAVPKPLASASPKNKFSTGKIYLPIEVENITRIHQLVLKNTSYGSNFATIHDVLKRFPQNTDRELVAMKVSLIDLTNSTNIGKHIMKISLSELVELILSIQDFDVRVAQGDPELVSQIARCNGKVNFFSFASKYCTYHNVDVYERDDYSIFDSVVKNALPYYIPGLKKATVNKWQATCNYTAFCDCIGYLLDQNNIHIPFRRRKFDIFLWYANRKNNALDLKSFQQ